MSKVSGNVQRQRGRAELVRLDDELVAAWMTKGFGKGQAHPGTASFEVSAQ
jgi:hypothetical protein